MDALDFLKKSSRKLEPLYVVHGDESLLKRACIKAIRHAALGDDDDEGAISVVSGDATTLAAVFDELETAPFFTPKRVVLVDSAETFVSQNRAALETRVTRLPAQSVLILDVKTWTATTRLAKIVPATQTLACKAPAAFKLPTWCVDWCASFLNKTLANAAAALLVELVGSDLGLLDQELRKLATFVGTRRTIETSDVDQLVGQQRAENTFKIFDAIGQGNAREALVIVGRLFDQGEDAFRLAGAFTWQLRRVAQTHRLMQSGLTAAAALAQVGVPPFGARSVEQMLRHLGPKRLDRLYPQLLRLNMGLRGDNPLPPRVQFERLVIWLARRVI
jgi:DNA polymerase-3 subunit delta